MPGWGSKSLQELMTLVSPHWDALSQDRKEEFTRRAKLMNGTQAQPGVDGVGSGARDALGRPLKDILDRDQQLKRKAERKIKDVDDLITLNYKEDNLENYEFFVLHANIFAKTAPENAEEIQYIPAEIAISKFSLRAGLTGTFQCFPSHGKIPLGYNYECRKESEKLQIPLSEGGGFKTVDDGRILQEIQKFMGETKICFIMPELEDQCRGVIDRIAQPPLSLSYLSLPRLLFKLKTQKALTEGEKRSLCPSEHIAER